MRTPPPSSKPHDVGSLQRPRRSPRILSHRPQQEANPFRDLPSVQRSLFSQSQQSSCKSIFRTLRSSALGDQSSKSIVRTPRSPTSEELDRQALSVEPIDSDAFPLPPPSLPLENTAQLPSSNYEVSAQPPPSTYQGTTKPPPSTFEGSTQPPPSTFEGTTQPPRSTYEGTTQSPSQGTVRQGDDDDEEERGQDGPDGRSEEVVGAEIEREIDLRRLFVHLNRITVHEQKLIAAAFNVLQQGNKKIRASRIFVIISGIMARTSRTALEVLEAKGVEKGKDFKAEFERTTSLWGAREENTIVPPIAQLENEAGVRQHPPPRLVDDLIDSESEEEDEVTAANRPSTGVTLEEFARLMIIFRDVPEAAEDLRRSGQDLSREDLDTGRTRNAFWADRIELIFNDPTFLTNERFDGPLQDLDPGRPITTFRSGSSLQDVFVKFRQEFTEIYGRWNVSGNMEHATFVNFCRLPRSKTLRRAGARCLIAFKVFRFGTSNQNTLLLDFCSKQMATESGAQLESGFGRSGPSGASSSRSKKRSADEIQDRIVGVLESLSQERTCTHEPSAKAAAAKAAAKEDDSANKKSKLDLTTIKIKHAQRESDKQLIDQLRAEHDHRVQMQHPVDERVTNMFDNYYSRLVEDALERLDQGGSRN